MNLKINWGSRRGVEPEGAGKSKISSHFCFSRSEFDCLCSFLFPFFSPGDFEN